MQQIIINVEDNKSDIVLNFIKNLKSDMVKSYFILKDQEEEKAYTELSVNAFEKIWDNKEDEIYDRFLK